MFAARRMSLPVSAFDHCGRSCQSGFHRFELGTKSGCFSASITPNRVQKLGTPKAIETVPSFSNAERG